MDKIYGKTFLTDIKDFRPALEALNIKNLVIQKTLSRKLFTDSPTEAIVSAQFIPNINIYSIDRNLASMIAEASLTMSIRGSEFIDDLIYPIQYSDI